MDQSAMFLLRLLRCLLLVGMLGLASLGCAAVAPVLHKEAAPDGNLCLVFGRSRVVHNGKDFDEKSGVVVGQYVAPFVSLEQARRGPVGKALLVQATAANRGYFEFTLPPGIYYVSEFLLWGVPPGRLGYWGLKSHSAAELPTSSRFLTVFRVERGKATYIGSMIHQTTLNNTRRNIGQYEVWESTWNMEVLDDTEMAAAWLRLNRPGWSTVMSTSIAEKRLAPP